MTAAPTGAAHFAGSARVSAAIAHVARLAPCADLKTIACHKPSLQLQCAFPHPKRYLLACIVCHAEAREIKVSRCNRAGCHCSLCSLQLRLPAWLQPCFRGAGLASSIHLSAEL